MCVLGGGGVWGVMSGEVFSSGNDSQHGQTDGQIDWLCSDR